MSIPIKITGKFKFRTQKLRDEIFKLLDEKSYLIHLNEAKQLDEKSIKFNIKNLVSGIAFNESISLLFEISEKASTGKVVCNCIEDNESTIIEAFPKHIKSFHQIDESVCWLVSNGNIYREIIGDNSSVKSRPVGRFIHMENAIWLDGNKAIFYGVQEGGPKYDLPSESYYSYVYCVDLLDLKTLWSLKLEEIRISVTDVWLSKTHIGFESIIVSLNGKLVQNVSWESDQNDYMNFTSRNDFLHINRNNLLELYSRDTLKKVKTFNLPDVTLHKFRYIDIKERLLIWEYQKDEITIIEHNRTKKIRTPISFIDISVSKSGETLAIWNDKELFILLKDQWIELKSRGVKHGLRNTMFNYPELNDHKLIGRRDDNRFMIWDFNNPQKPEILNFKACSSPFRNAILDNSFKAYAIDLDFDFVEIAQL